MLWVQRPMLFLAVALMSGVTLGACLPGYPLIACVVATALAAGLIFYIARRRSAMVLPLLFLVAVGYLSIQPWLAPRMPDQHISRFANQGKWEIRGGVVEEPLYEKGRLKFVLNTRHLTQKSASIPVCGYLYVTAPMPAPSLARGDRVRFYAHVRSVRNFSNPGGFDYERFMALRGILARAYVDRKGLRVIQPAEPATGFNIPGRIRGFLSRRMDLTFKGKSRDSLHLLKALTLGDRNSLSDELRDEFARAGVGHLLAISGLHIGIVALCAYTLAARLLMFWPLFVTRAWGRKAASLAALVAVCLYGTLAGLSPSTQRAMVMAVAFLAVWWVGRGHDWFNTLAAAALLLLILTPHILLSISFQLSFAAVATILLGLNREARARASQTSDQGPGLRLAARFTAFGRVTLLATLGTLPLVMHYFNRISLVGPAANLIAVPLAGSLAVPLGLCGCLLAGISPVLAGWVWQAAALPLTSVLAVVHWICRWPYAAVTCVTPNSLEIALYFAGIWLILIPGRHFLKIVALASIVAVGGADAAYWLRKRYASSDVCVTALDVGQGTANLLQLPGGFTALVDGGGFSDTRIFDVGERIVAPLLWRNKIRTVDLVVLSHPNADHLNGLIFILEHFTVGEVWSNHQPEHSFGYARWSAAIKNRGIPHRPFEQLPRASVHGRAIFEILSPPRDFLVRSRNETWRDLNENSLVLKVSYGSISFLFSGDIGWRTEKEMVHGLDPACLKSTILFLPHHGSRKSNSMAYLKAVQPREAVISAGWQNRFHFPHAKTLERLTRAGVTAWRTDLCGAVSIFSDGRDYWIGTCRRCDNYDSQ